MVTGLVLTPLTPETSGAACDDTRSEGVAALFTSPVHTAPARSHRATQRSQESSQRPQGHTVHQQTTGRGLSSLKAEDSIL